ncbi:MAG: DotD/TraH family lipoprotein [Alphaproteobacteria bacterium]|nr:DotD/TraH family lipoprotein [Alphaproteobacteria bacterium]
MTAGRPPPAPVMVEIAAEDAPLIRIFGDAGMQAADRALLTVDAGRMTVRLDWFEDRRVEKRPGS